MKVRIYQSLWAMEGLPYRAPEWSLEEQVERVSAAGFDGLEVAWTPAMPAGAEAIDRAAAAGLAWSIVCFPTTVDDFKAVAERFAETDVSRVTIQPNVRPLTVLEGVPYILGWLEIAREAGFAVHFETHRNRMTTSLRYTLQLLDAVPTMRLVADLSHYVVGEEFGWPIDKDNNVLIRRILSRSDGFHGRVASREQVQIPISFDYHREWLELFLGWWEDGLSLWRESAERDDEFIFVTELGPPTWYAITGADGEELSDRWQEALQLKSDVRKIWERIESRV